MGLQPCRRLASAWRRLPWRTSPRPQARSGEHYRQGLRLCPKCGTDAIIKGKKEYGGGWLCFGKKGGCGTKWKDGDAAIEGQSTERVPNDDLADQYNTVLKMANKRSLVAAVLNATAASDIFTQDIEEDGPGDDAPVLRLAMYAAPLSAGAADGLEETYAWTASEVRRKLAAVGVTFLACVAINSALRARNYFADKSCGAGMPDSGLIPSVTLDRPGGEWHSDQSPAGVSWFLTTAIILRQSGRRRPTGAARAK